MRTSVGPASRVEREANDAHERKIGSTQEQLCCPHLLFEHGTSADVYPASEHLRTKSWKSDGYFVMLQAWLESGERGHVSAGRR